MKNVSQIISETLLEKKHSLDKELKRLHTERADVVRALNSVYGTWEPSPGHYVYHTLEIIEGVYECPNCGGLMGRIPHGETDRCSDCGSYFQRFGNSLYYRGIRN